MKRGLVCSLILLLCASASAQLQTYSLDFELSKTKFADTIKVMFEDGRLLVPVSIGGRRYNFMLDTGASHAVVYDDAMIKGCVPLGIIPSNDSNKQRDTVQMVRLPALRIGSLSLRNCRATVQHRRIKEANVDGILGFDLVNKGLLMKIDVRRGHMILTDLKRHFDGEGGCVMKYRQNFHVPYLVVMPFQKYRERVLFDTGSRRLFYLNSKSFAENEHRMVNRKQIEGRSRGSVSIGYSGTETMGEVVFLALDDFRMGDCSFTDLHVITTQGNSHIGADVLKYGAVTFNPFRKEIRFQPYDGRKTIRVNNPRKEKAVVPDKNGRPMIGLLWEKSDLYKDGFRVGDVILTVDGQAIGLIEDYKRKFHPIRNYRHTFTIRDEKGHLKEIRTIWLK